MFDYDDSVNMAFDAKIAGKNLVTAKHELLTKTGDFLFMAHSDRELAFRMQMVEEDIERTAHRRLANVSDSKAKLVRAVFDEWSLRHASCQFCKVAAPLEYDEPKNKVFFDQEKGTLHSRPQKGRSYPGGTCDGCGETIGLSGGRLPAFIDTGIPGHMIDTRKVDPGKISELPKGTPAYCKHCAIKIMSSKTAKDSYTNDPNSYKGRKDPEWMAKNGPNDYHQHYPSSDKEGGFTCPGCGRLFHTREQATGAYGTCGACDLGKNPRNPNYNRRDEMGHPAPNSEFPFSPSGHNPKQDDKNNFNKKASDDDYQYHWDPSKKTPYPSQVPNKKNPNKTTPWHEKPQQPYPVKNPDYPNKGEGLRKNDTLKRNPEIHPKAPMGHPYPYPGTPNTYIEPISHPNIGMPNQWQKPVGPGKQDPPGKPNNPWHEEPQIHRSPNTPMQWQKPFGPGKPYPGHEEPPYIDPVRHPEQKTPMQWQKKPIEKDPYHHGNEKWFNNPSDD